MPIRFFLSFREAKTGLTWFQTHINTHTLLVTDVGRPCGGSVVCCGRGCIHSDSTGSGVRPYGGDTSDTHLR